LNESNERRSTHSTKLSVLTILANLAKDPTSKVKDEVKMVLGGVSEWFDEYLQAEPVGGSDAETGVPLEPEMHKTMLLVLCRCYDYALQTEDLFELSGNNKATALVTVVALLEEGETYTTALTQRRGPAAAGSASAGKGPAQWEKQLVIERYERPLVRSSNCLYTTASLSLYYYICLYTTVPYVSIPLPLSIFWLCDAGFDSYLECGDGGFNRCCSCAGCSKDSRTQAPISRQRKLKAVAEVVVAEVVVMATKT
jgi:hypothetical protein